MPASKPDYHQCHSLVYAVDQTCRAVSRPVTKPLNQPLEAARGEMERHAAAESTPCRDARDDAAERERREKVRAVSERVRAENREILDRLATK